MKKLIKRIKVLVQLTVAIAAVISVQHLVYARDAQFALLEREINIQPSVVSKPPSKPSWTYADKIKEAELLLADTGLYVGSKNITYYEERFSYSNGKISKTKKKFSTPEREIAIVLLNNETGELKKGIITKRGEKLIAPPELPVTIVPRTNGIVWNYWNTMYEAPSPYIVLLNKWPQEEGKGKKRKIEYMTYSPYSSDLHKPELIESGRGYLQNVIVQAMTTLRTRGVRSRAFTDSLVSDVQALKTEYFERLPIIEHTDLGEFVSGPLMASQRVLVLFGANKSRAFAYTGSNAGARGAFQYTRGTWDLIRKTYPAAKLPNFDTGSVDHVSSAMAAILLYDDNLRRLTTTFGEKIADDPRLEEYLAASYNGNPNHVLNSLRSTIAKQLENWGIRLKSETNGYLAKIRELRKLDLFKNTVESKALPIS